jgi:hypothetical protein
MINENMKKVLVALRSGEYKQTKEALQNSSGHCCLGVMCEVYEKETGDIIDRRTSGNIMGGNLSRHEKVQTWVGLLTSSGDITIVSPNSSKHISLAHMNDSEGKTFSEIADFIESEPKGLLV